MVMRFSKLSPVKVVKVVILRHVIPVIITMRHSLTNTLLNYLITKQRYLKKLKNIQITSLFLLTPVTFSNVVFSKMIQKFLRFFGLVTQVMLVQVLLVESYLAKLTHQAVQSIHGLVILEQIQHGKTSLVTLKQTQLKMTKAMKNMSLKIQCSTPMAHQLCHGVVIKHIPTTINQTGLMKKTKSLRVD